MKKILFLASMLLLIGIGKTMAEQDDLFTYNVLAIENEFASLSRLEIYLQNHEDETFASMVADGSNLTDGISAESLLSSAPIMNENTLGIPSFLWGCIGNVPGVI